MLYYEVGVTTAYSDYTNLSRLQPDLRGGARSDPESALPVQDEGRDQLQLLHLGAAGQNRLPLLCHLRAARVDKLLAGLA